MRKELSKDIFHQLKKMGINQKQISYDMGLSNQCISKWNCHGIPENRIKEITKLYGIEIKFNLERKDV